MSNIFAASKPTLTYFDLYGRGEAIRMALAHSKTEFLHLTLPLFSELQHSRPLRDVEG